MKKLIVGLVFAGLLLSPLSVVRAQTVEPADREAIMAQLQVIYVQLVQMLTQLQAQLAAQIADQSNQITSLQNQNTDNSKKIDQIVTNTTPVASPPPESTSTPTEVPVVKELVVKTIVGDRSKKGNLGRNVVVLGQDSPEVFVQVLHDNVAVNVPIEAHSSDLDVNRDYFDGRVRNSGMDTGNTIEDRHLNSNFSIIGFDVKKIGNITITVEAEGMSKSVDFIVIKPQ